MKVTKLTPLGYCHGVLRAINITKKALMEENKPIYILGSIIHNRFIVDAFSNEGIITIEAKDKKRIDLLDEIDHGTVIFTAHGVSPLVYEKALAKGLKVIDATCKDVLRIHDNYKKYLNLGYTCLYVGKRNHPEVEGVLGIDKNIILIEKKEDLDNIKGDKLYISNQTTLSDDDVNKIFEYAKNKYENILFDNERCKATTNRQNALKNNDTDLCYIIGDQKSSNTKKLLEVSSNYVKTIMIESVNDINYKDLLEINSVSISAGASTPKEIIDDVYNYLLQFEKENKETYNNKINTPIKI